MSIWQNFLLCSSIISSPIYENDRSNFSFDWTSFKKNAVQENTIKHENKLLTFKNEEHFAEEWISDYVYCKSSIQEDLDPLTTKKNLLITRSYDDNFSIYVSTEENGITVLSGYFKNVHILMNAHVPTLNDPPPQFRG